MDFKALWHDKGADILTGLAVVGVFGTAIMAAKDTPKALKMMEQKEEFKVEQYGYKLTKTEKVIALIPGYLPTILMGLATAGCIVGANNVNKQHQAALISAYMSLNTSYQEYQRKVKDIFGEEAEKKVREEIANDRYMHEYLGSVDEKRLFYDEFSKRYFEMSLYEFQRAMYEFNRIFNHLGEMTLNDFYEFVKLDPTELGNKIGWNAHKDWECRGFSWVEAHIVQIDTPDGLQAFGITFNVDPNKDFQEW